MYDANKIDPKWVMGKNLGEIKGIVYFLDEYKQKLKMVPRINSYHGNYVQVKCGADTLTIPIGEVIPIGEFKNRLAEYYEQKIEYYSEKLNEILQGKI